MASQPFEVCSVTLLFRESDEVFLKQSHRLVHSSRINPLFFCVSLNWQWFLAVVTLLFLRETPPPLPKAERPMCGQRWRCHPTRHSALWLQLEEGCTHKKIKIGEQQTQIWSAGARNASVLPLCTAMGETQSSGSNGPVTVNPTLCAHVELKLLKL